MKLLDTGVETILDGDEFKRYLAFAARFHRYSANNSLLVLLRRPNATRIAGYKKWQELGRQVRRGEEGLKILALIFRTEEDEESGEKEHVLYSFKVVKVFDVSQTDPAPGASPLPEKPRPRGLRGDSDVARALTYSLLGFCGSEGLSVSKDDAELNALCPGANGVYLSRENRILLKSTLSADGRAKTLAHELAHHLLHRDATGSEEDRPTLEAEAEGTAYAVLSYFGVDTSEYSFAYVARWAESNEVVKAALSNIQKTVRKIIEAVEDGGPRAEVTTECEAARASTADRGLVPVYGSCRAAWPSVSGRWRRYSSDNRGEEIMKSAEARSQVRGMFQTTAIRSSALTSGSWGWAVRGSQKKMRRSISPSAIQAPICISPPSGPLRTLVTGIPSSSASIPPVVPVAYSSCCASSLSLDLAHSSSSRFLLSWATRAIFFLQAITISLRLTGPSFPSLPL
jgi:hypothetical protein